MVCNEPALRSAPAYFFNLGISLQGLNDIPEFGLADAVESDVDDKRSIRFIQAEGG